MKRVNPQEDFCVACRLCEVYCTTEHSQAKDPIRAYKEEKPFPLTRIFLQKEGATSIAINCRHCDEPRCAWSCVSGALSKNPVTGVVEYQANKCIGCWTCIVACPYGVITRDVSRSKIAKCDMCPDRQIPACIAVCPNRSLVLAEAE